MIFGLAAISFIPVEIKFLSGGFVLALGIIGLIWYLASQKKSKKETWQLVKELDWETIFFLIGIFIVIAGIQSVGLLEDFAGFLAGLTKGSKILGFFIILLVSIIISGFVLFSDTCPEILVFEGREYEQFKLLCRIVRRPFCRSSGSCLSVHLPWTFFY